MCEVSGITKIPEMHVSHIINVLRMKADDEIIIYNETCGEWISKITSIKKNEILVEKIEMLRSNKHNNNLSLAFGIIKSDPLKWMLEKITELGVTDIYPIITDYTTSGMLRHDKCEKILISASEQSERLDVPKIYEPTSFSDFIKFIEDGDEPMKWYSALERSAATVKNSDISMDNLGVGFIVGPEGGFSKKEKNILVEKTSPITLSTNILRAETAAVVCCSIAGLNNV